MPGSVPLSDRHLAQMLAEVADAIARMYLQHRPEPTSKADGSPVTSLDLIIEKTLVDLLAEYRSADAVIGEESGEHGPAGASRRWLIDPIDGTRSLISGGTAWGSHIALVDDEGVVVGVVTRPASGTSFLAARGQGAVRRQGETVTPLDLTTAIRNEPPRVAGFVDEPSPGARLFRERGWWLDDVDDPFVELMSGELDALLDEGGNPWDIAPLCCLVTEAGGVIQDPAGQPLPFSRWSFARRAGAESSAALFEELFHAAP